jgi:hypothetical protein
MEALNHAEAGNESQPLVAERTKAAVVETEEMRDLVYDRTSHLTS